jgi:hypothetical protein
MTGAVDASVTRCANCGAALQGPFCAACGQAVKPLDPPVRHFVGEFVQEFFDVDGRLLRTLRRLVFAPGFLTREHAEGRRAPWLSPLKLYLLTSVAAFAMLTVAGDDGGLKIEVKGGTSAEAFQYLGYTSAEQLAAAIDAAREVWLPRVLFVVVPIFGWLVSRVRRRAGRHYPSHLVFALHVHAAAFAVRAAMTALALALPPIVKPGLDAVVGAYVVGYLYRAFVVVYGGGRLRAVRDTMVVGALYWLVLLVGSGAAVLAVVFGRYLLGAVTAWVAARKGLGV